MSSWDAWIASGKELGLSGEALSKFVAEREQREDQKERDQADREERRAAREAKAEQDHAAREAQKEHEERQIEMKRIDLEIAKIQAARTTTNGKALDAYSRLSKEESCNYDYYKLKEASLTRYDISGEDCVGDPFDLAEDDEGKARREPIISPNKAEESKTHKLSPYVTAGILTTYERQARESLKQANSNDTVADSSSEEIIPDPESEGEQWTGIGDHYFEEDDKEIGGNGDPESTGAKIWEKQEDPRLGEPFQTCMMYPAEVVNTKESAAGISDAMVCWEERVRDFVRLVEDDQESPEAEAATEDLEKAIVVEQVGEQDRKATSDGNFNKDPQFGKDFKERPRHEVESEEEKDIGGEEREDSVERSPVGGEADADGTRGRDYYDGWCNYGQLVATKSLTESDEIRDLTLRKSEYFLFPGGCVTNLVLGFGGRLPNPQFDKAKPYRNRNNDMHPMETDSLIPRIQERARQKKRFVSGPYQLESIVYVCSRLAAVYINLDIMLFFYIS